MSYLERNYTMGMGILGMTFLYGFLKIKTNNNY